MELLRQVAAEHPDRAAFVEVDRRLTLRGVGPRGRRRRRVSSPSRAWGPATSWRSSCRRRSTTRSATRPRCGCARSRPASTPGSGRPRSRASSTARHRASSFATPTSTAVRARVRMRLPPISRVCEPDDPVAIVWTSGTTGMPKGAVFDHRNLRAVAIGAGAMGAPLRRAARAAPVRARRVHVAAVGGDRERDHDGDHADAVDGRRRAPT